MDAKIYLEKGNELYEQAKLPESISNYKKAIELKPDYIQALLQLLKISETQKNWSETIKYCRQILAFAPQRHGVYIRLARALSKQNKIYGAIAAYKEAIELKPDVGAGVYKEYGDLLTRIKDTTPEAIAAYQQAAEIKSNWGINFYVKLANLYEQQGDLERATTYCLKTIELQPDNPQRYFKIGNIYARRDAIKEAIGNYQKALELKPDFCNVYKRLGDVLQQRNQLDDAAKCYKKALEIKPDFKNAYRALGDVLKQQGMPQQARQCYQLASQII